MVACSFILYRIVHYNVHVFEEAIITLKSIKHYRKIKKNYQIDKISLKTIYFQDMVLKLRHANGSSFSQQPLTRYELCEWCTLRTNQFNQLKTVFINAYKNCLSSKLKSIFPDKRSHFLVARSTYVYEDYSFLIAYIDNLR